MNVRKRGIAEGILFTDQYQLTMAQLYFGMGMHEIPACFEHFFRKYPNYGSHQAGYCVNAGLEWLLEWLEKAHFTKKNLEYLRRMQSVSGAPLFKEDFLSWLAVHGNFKGVSIYAIAEGRVVHPNEPLTVVTGPLAMVQILESPLLNQLNYQTLIATKAARMKATAGESTLLEFGMRRAQGLGANAGVRGALIGGADFSSNAGISHLLGKAPKGTHAHSMVQAFLALGGSELDAFRAYADIFPDDCLLLVDTVDTLQSGVPNAIKVFEELARRGHRPLGIRLDSGDLAHLAVRAAKMLNEAGFPETAIVLSNELDEAVMRDILAQIRKEAETCGVEPRSLIKRLIYGVGTSLITSKGAPALDGVYKLTAIKHGEWLPALKISETPLKTLTPGPKKAWRIYDPQGVAVADLLTTQSELPDNDSPLELWHQFDPQVHITLPADKISRIEPLLVDVWRQGNATESVQSIDRLRQRRIRDEQCLHPAVKRLVNPEPYNVSLSRSLRDLKNRQIEKIQKTLAVASGSHAGEIATDRRGTSEEVSGEDNRIGPERFKKGDALLIVDVQKDFCPGGSLSIEEGDAVVPVLNKWISGAEKAGIAVYASRDWHPGFHPSFKEQGGPWPQHCLADSDGANFHEDLHLPDSAVIISKGVRFDHDQNSAFNETGLAEELRRAQVKRLWVGGLALDVCVLATVLDARKEGFPVRLIRRATRSVSVEGGQQALKKMIDAGAEIIDE